MRRTYFLFAGLCLYLAVDGNAQISSQQGYHWYFGKGYGLDFSLGEVQRDFNTSMNTFECACTMSDSIGNLLYYTNGGGRISDNFQGFIWNRLHQPMAGGDLGTSTGGGYSAAQGCITFPKPGAAHEYYIFTVDEKETLQDPDLPFPEGKGLRFFEIDMEANGGLGEVTVANQPLGQTAFEYIGATRHTNCEDYWLFVPTGNHVLEDDPAAADTLNIYAVTEIGIELHQQLPLPEGDLDRLDEIGPIKISPDGQFITMGTFLHRFDPSTGFIDSTLNLQTPIQMGYEDPLAFSGDSRFLVHFRWERQDTFHTIRAIQYDLLDPEFPSTFFSIGQVQHIGFLKVGIPQLAPDQRIYLPLQYDFFTSPPELAVIHQPMIPGPMAGFDGRFMTLEKPSNEQVIHLGNFTDHLFSYQPTIDIDLGDDLALSCTSTTLTALEAPPGFSQYLWSTGDRDSILLIGEPGTYWVHVGDACTFGADTIEVDLDEEGYLVDLGADLSLCEGEEVLILPALNFDPDGYLWQDGSTDPAFVSTEETEIHLTAQIGQCAFEDSVFIDRLALPRVDLGADTLLCDDQMLKLSAGVIDGLPIYTWQDGSAASFFNVESSGPYFVEVSNECGVASDSINVFVVNCSQQNCEVFVPNIFTPNEDGINDRFEIFSNCNFERFEIEIFSRWGDLVFASNQLDQQWDGMLKGQRCPSSVYAYRLTYRLVDFEGKIFENVMTGDVALVR